MNPTISALQQSYPLSPRKYWKKMFDKIISFAILWDGLGLAVFFAVITNFDNIFWQAALFGLGVAFVPYFICISLYSWYVKTYIKRYYYAGEEHFITIKKGVFAPAEIHVQWQKIQDVYVDQDIIDRIMGLYDVHIASATAASGIEAHIDGVDQAAAEGLKKFLLDKVAMAGRGMTSAGPMGSTMAATMPAQDSTAASAMPAAATGGNAPLQQVSFGREISSNVYPLSSRWFTVTILSRFVGSLLTSIFVALFIALKFSTGPDGVKVFNFFGTTALIFFGIFIVMLIYQFVSLLLWKKNYAFNFGPDNLYYRTGVIALAEKHMPYSSVQDVTTRQSFWERIFGLASVRVENAAQEVVYSGRNQMTVQSGVVLMGLSIADANTITDLLKTTILGRASRQYGL